MVEERIGENIKRGTVSILRLLSLVASKYRAQLSRYGGMPTFGVISQIAKSESLDIHTVSAAKDFLISEHYIFEQELESQATGECIMFLYISKEGEEFLEANKEKTEIIEQVDKQLTRIDRPIHEVFIEMLENNPEKYFPTVIEAYSRGARVPFEANERLREAIGTAERKLGISVKGKTFAADRKLLNQYLEEQAEKSTEKPKNP